MSWQATPNRSSICSDTPDGSYDYEDVAELDEENSGDEVKRSFVGGVHTWKSNRDVSEAIGRFGRL